MAKITIKVTRSDIMEGTTGNSTQCAVARAARRAGFKKLRVGGSYLAGTYKGERYNLELPARATNFIYRFDESRFKAQRKELKPFSFRLWL